MSEPGADLPSAARARLDELCGLFLKESAAVDAGELPLSWHLDALARSGFYGAFAPVQLGGLGLSYDQLCAVVEELASCCLSSTFVWVQHFRLLGAALAAEAPPAMSQRLCDAVVRGDVKGGVALTGLMPGPVRLRAEPDGAGWALRGEAPWVSGWGMVDLVLVAARTGDDEVLTLLMEAHEQPGVRVAPLRLSAADATRTVKLTFEGMAVPASSVVGLAPLEEAQRAGERLRLNGSFALGVARRSLALLGPSPLDGELVARRHALDRAGDDTVAAARAAANELAVRASHALAVQRGSASALAGDVAERLSREAAFLLVFASRPAIKASLLASLGAGAAGGGEPPPRPR